MPLEHYLDHFKVKGAHCLSKSAPCASRVTHCDMRNHTQCSLIHLTCFYRGLYIISHITLHAHSCRRAQMDALCHSLHQDNKSWDAANPVAAERIKVSSGWKWAEWSLWDELSSKRNTESPAHFTIDIISISDARLKRLLSEQTVYVWASGSGFRKPSFGDFKYEQVWFGAAFDYLKNHSHQKQILVCR